jgi:hypothetical protein
LKAKTTDNFRRRHQSGDEAFRKKFEKPEYSNILCDMLQQDNKLVNRKTTDTNTVISESTR